MNDGSSNGQDVPHAAEAERQILAAVLEGGEDAQTEFVTHVSPSDFYMYQGLAETVAQIHDEDGVADPATVQAKMDSYPSEVLSVTPDEKSVKTLALKIRGAASLRESQHRIVSILRQIQSGEAEADDVLEQMEELVVGVSQRQHQGAADRIGEHVGAVMETLHEEEGSSVVGVPSGIEPIDSETRGWHDGTMIVLAGRPHQGKTNFTMNSLLHAAKNGYRAGMVSLEMPASSLTERSLYIESGVEANPSGTRIHRPKEDWDRLDAAAAKIEPLPFFVDDTPHLTPRGVVARVRRMHVERDLDIAAVDYIQKMTPPDDTNEDWIGRACHRFQGLAQELGIPIICISQMNRYAEHRSNPEPQMSDLRESGGIEEAADVIGFLYRPATYGIMQDEAGRSTEGVARFLVPKDRAKGSAFTADLFFDEDCGRFGALERDEMKASGPSGPTPNPDDPPF